MHILGISAFFHDSAACIVRDGRIVAAAQEERFTRVKHDPRFPEHAVRYCLDAAGISIDDVGYVGFYEKPYIKFERILRTHAREFPRGWSIFQRAIPLWLEQKLWQPGHIRDRLIALSPSSGGSMRWDGRVIFCEHHRSHAASAFYPSPFGEAAILTLDGVGEWATTTVGVGRTDHREIPRIELLGEIRYPHSLGMLYSAFTWYLGFKVNSGEYKVMGLAPYGDPRFADRILDELIDLRSDGSFELNMQYFTFPHDPIMVNDRFARLFDVPPRNAAEPLTEVHMDIAASVQKVTERVVLAAARHAHERTGMRDLCLAGGVALNCVANGVILREGPFRDVWIQPAAGDAGGAVGVALHVHHEHLERRRTIVDDGADRMEAALLGPRFTNDEVRATLDAWELPYEVHDDEDALVGAAADLLASGQSIGWFQGRMEFGARLARARFSATHGCRRRSGR